MAAEGCWGTAHKCHCGSERVWRGEVGVRHPGQGPADPVGVRHPGQGLADPASCNLNHGVSLSQGRVESLTPNRPTLTSP